MLEERIVALEEKFSHQDHLVDQLNKIVAKQEVMIESLAYELQELRQNVQNAGQGGQVTNLKDEVPPHY
jgi:SlyX protein